MLIKAALSGDNHHNNPGRIEEAHRVHEWMLGDWKARGAHFIGFAGDWNEVPPNERDQAWSRDFFGRCADVASVILLEGNHDPFGALSEFHLQNEYKYPITVVSQPDVIVVDTEAGPLAVACVPFVWKAHLLAKLGPMSAEESDRLVQIALSDIFRGLGVKVRALNLPTIALIHGKWRGSKLNEEQPNRPLGMEIPIENIGMLGADAVCMAHIHLAQETTFNNRPIWTPSSPYYVDFGESKHEKGYIWCELPTDRELIPVLQRIPTPVAPMILLEYKWEGGMFIRVSDGEQVHESHFDPAGCDLRFRYHYSKDSAVQAKSAVAEVEASLIAQGALKVKLDPVPIPVESTRSLEIVKATTLTEQARLLWKKWDLKLTKEDEAALTNRIEEIQTECGFGQRLTLDAGIHVKSTRMKGWRCFPNEVNVDFDAIEGEVVAVSGPNGTGKSLYWELAVLGALYREVPTHGKIGDHAIARDTFIETRFEYAGKDYTVSQILDGKDNSGSTSLKIGTAPVFGTETALRSQYDKWAEENLPPLSLVTSTTFMPQESKGILGMGATARKSLILKAKGVERYEVLADAARKRSAAVSKELESVKGRLSELRSYGQTVEFCEQALARTTDEKRVGDETLRLGELTLKDLQTKNVEIEKQRVEYDRLIAQRNALNLEEQKLRQQIADLETKLAVNRELISEETAINEAVIEIANLQQHLDNCQERDRNLRIQESGTRSRIELAQAAIKSQRQNKAIAERAIEELRITLRARASIEVAIKTLPDFEEAVSECIADRDGALREYEEVSAQAISGKDERIIDLRSGLEYIRDCDDPLKGPGIAAETVGEDDKAQQGAEDHPKLLAQAKAAWQQREYRVKEVERQLRRLKSEVERMPQIEDAEQKKEELEKQIAECDSEIEAITENLARLNQQLGELTLSAAANNASAKKVSAEIGALKPLAAKADILAGTKARIEEMELQLIPLKGNYESLMEETSNGCWSPKAPPPLINLTAEEQALAKARTAANGALSAFTLAQKALEDAQAKEARLQELSIQVGGLEKDVDRWSLVERTCGKDGLIAESVAAAGDEINERANELLRASGNTKYTIDLKTTKMTKDGKREIEGCPINIYNSETGEWQEGSTLSPGQRAFVNLPIALTLAELGCKESKVKPTIYMDEPTAGLDPIMRIQFVAMMRDVAQNMDAKIFFVTHNEELMALADARMEINSGSIVIS